MRGRRLSTREWEVVRALLDAYRIGAFPMGDPESGEVHWYRPDPRAVIPLQPEDAFHVSRSLARRIRSGWFELRADSAFDRVIRGCADRRTACADDGGTWLTDEMIGWYELLFAAGHAHSVEAWRPDVETGSDALVGGVYGVSIGGAFFAESMFSRPRARLEDGSRHPLDGTDASSVALASLVSHVRWCGYTLFDVQFRNEHIARFGVVEVPCGAYLRELERAVRAPDPWRAMRFDGTG